MLRYALARAAVDSALAAMRAGRPLELSSPELNTVLDEIVRRGTMLEPTLFVYGDAPERLAVAAAITRRAHQAGVELTAGTDSIAGTDALIPNLHEELQLLVERAGLTPAEALRAATRNAAEAIGVLDSRGTIEAGKLADLVVLRADPLRDIRNTRQIEMVFKHGKAYRPGD